MYKIYHKVRSAKRDGTGTVYVMLRCANGEEVTRTTGVSVTTKDFNTTTGKVSVKDILHIEKNEAIRLVVVDLEHAATALTIKEISLTKAGIETEYPKATQFRLESPQRDDYFIKRLENDIPTIEREIERLQKELLKHQRFLRHLRGEEDVMGTKRDLFTDRIDEYINTAMTMKKETTRSNYAYLRNLIHRYNPHLQIQEINLNVLNGLQIYLASTPTKDGTKRRNSSILAHLVHLQAVYEYFAVDLGLPTAFFKRFEKVKKLANENVVYMTKEELEDFATLPLKAELHQRVRDQFLVFCYTGLRQVDGCIKRADVFETKARKGRKYKEIRLNQEKVNSLVSIPLSSRAEEILERNNYNFEPIPNNHFNQALKQIAQKVASLQYDFTVTNFNGPNAIPDTKPKWKFISGKVGRKTFVNNCFDEGVSETTVAAWLGHKNTLMVQKHYKHRGDIAKGEAYKILR